MVDREKMRDISVTGNLPDDPQVRQGAYGSFVTMRIIENQREFDREQQQWVDGDPVGYDVAIGNERLAKHSLNNLSRGDRVTVRGDVQVSPYVHKKTGEAGLNRRMSARDVQVSMFDDRFDPSVGVEHDRSQDIETDRTVAAEAGRTVDQELTAQGNGEVFYERRPEGTPPPPGPPQQTATVNVGQPTPEQQREVAQRQQRAEQSWAAAAQQQHQMRPQAGFGGVSM